MKRTCLDSSVLIQADVNSLIGVLAQSLVLMPQARSKHQPRRASNKTNTPKTANVTPSQTERK